MKKLKKNYKKNIQIFIIGSFIAFMLIFLSYLFFAERPMYRVVLFNEDQSVEEVAVYQDFKHAKNNMQILIDQGYENPAIIDDSDRILAIRYGLVNFHTKEVTENTNFTYVSNNEKGYLNGSYGGDGAYLSTSDNGKEVEFMMSGARGKVSIDDIEIINYYDSNKIKSSSYYEIRKDTLYHIISTNPLSEEVAAIQIGELQPYFIENYYYSYDGMYFYEDYPTMIDDYRNNTYKNSINTYTAYINYYQYITHRTISNYTADVMNAYVNNNLGYQLLPLAYPMADNESQLVERGSYFIRNQDKYGVNAFMMFALACNESSYGKSELSFTNNNLFGHGAYDENPTENASGYHSIPECIETHAKKFMNQGYLNPLDERYHGGYYGNKGSGINVKYASDPYWGEKAAAFYRNIDQNFGKQDGNKYKLGLTIKDNVNFYTDSSTDAPILFTSNKNETFVILDTIEANGNTWYKLQSDGIINETKDGFVEIVDQYNFEANVVYALKENFE